MACHSDLPAICKRPLCADSVEKVLSGVGTNFLRTAGALGVLGRGGPLQPERIQPVAFADALRDIANRIRRSARFCANFVAAIFSAFSTESERSGHQLAGKIGWFGRK
jgi:hypothetical protein